MTLSFENFIALNVSFGSAGADLEREVRKRLLAWRHLLQLLRVYEAAAPGFVDADTANDLAVISSRAFQPDGSFPEPEGALSHAALVAGSLS